MEPLNAILAFLEEISLPMQEGSVPADSFLPGIRVSRGMLIFDRPAVRWPGDLLHEAGHIAMTPAAVRPALEDALDLDGSVPQAGEAEVTAWAYAAIVHLRLPPSLLFHEGGYRGHSPGLITTYSRGVYPGAFGLAMAGMTLVGEEARRAGVAPYPRMTRWLRE